MGKVITVASQKGGVGKSTSCVNLGIGLAREGKSIFIHAPNSYGKLSISGETTHYYYTIIWDDKEQGEMRLAA